MWQALHVNSGPVSCSGPHQSAYDCTKCCETCVSSLILYQNKTVFRKSHPVINSVWHTKSKWNIDHLATSQYSAGTPCILASTWMWFNPLHPPKRCSRQNQNSSQFFMRVTRSFYWIWSCKVWRQTQHWALCHGPRGVPEQFLRCCGYYSFGGIGVIRMCCTVARWSMLFTGRGFDVVGVYLHE